MRIYIYNYIPIIYAHTLHVAHAIMFFVCVHVCECLNIYVQ